MLLICTVSLRGNPTSEGTRFTQIKGRTKHRYGTSNLVSELYHNNFGIAGSEKQRPNLWIDLIPNQMQFMEFYLMFSCERIISRSQSLHCLHRGHMTGTLYKSIVKSGSHSFFNITKISHIALQQFSKIRDWWKGISFSEYCLLSFIKLSYACSYKYQNQNLGWMPLSRSKLWKLGNAGPGSVWIECKAGDDQHSETRCRGWITAPQSNLQIRFRVATSPTNWWRGIF